MSGFIGSIVGTGAALLPLGLALLLVKYRHHLQRLHRRVPEWLLIAAIALMVLAGSMFAIVGAGHWIVAAISWVLALVGPVGHVVLALVALFLLFRVGTALLSQPDEKVMGAAFMAPIVFSMFNVGIFASINGFLAPLGQEAATRIGSFLGA